LFTRVTATATPQSAAALAHAELICESAEKGEHVSQYATGNVEGRADAIEERFEPRAREIRQTWASETHETQKRAGAFINNERRTARSPAATTAAVEQDGFGSDGRTQTNIGT